VSDDDGRTENCMVCGSKLEYLNQAVDVVCRYCDKVEAEHIRCPNGHYICDDCHNKGALKVIEDITYTAKSRDPFEIAELMMSYPGLPMLGCVHAYIAAGALLAGIRNEGSRKIEKKDIREVFRRTGKQAHGGYCGLTGVCGIAPAVGACYAELTGSKCGCDIEQKKTMEVVCKVAQAIKDLTGPSCCKAYVRAGLEEAAVYMNQTLAIDLPARPRKSCVYSDKHPHGCRHSKCPYYQE
jgi:hypothetical protein